MQFDTQQKRVRQGDGTTQAGAPSLLAKVLAAVLGAALLVVGFAVSLVMLAVVVGAMIVIGGFVWWKTRALRKQLREQIMRAQQMREQELRDQQARERAGPQRDFGGVIEDVEFHEKDRQN